VQGHARVWFEGKHDAFAVVAFGQGPNAFQNPAMAGVHPVEGAYRQNRVSERGQLFKVCEYAHFGGKYSGGFRGKPFFDFD